MNDKIRIKTGDTFFEHVKYTPANDDDPADLSTFTLKSQLRTPTNELVFDVATQMDPDFMGFTMGLTDAQTAQIQPGQYLTDVLFIYGGTKKHSETFIIEVEQGITQ